MNVDITICIITFNHEKYIRECIESVLSQKINASIEIIIGDDGSTDNTSAICREYTNRFPEKVKYYCWDRGNVIYFKGRPTGKQNTLNLFKAAKGKYIAILEGDDFWCDEYKLQKQFDQLESNPELILSHHWQHYSIIDVKGDFALMDAPKLGQGFHPAEIADVKDVFLNKLRCKSRTLMFRNIIKDFPDWYKRVAFGDVALTIILGKYGKFGFINKPMAVYRQTGAGAASIGKGKEDFFFNRFTEWIQLWEEADSYFEGKYRKEANATILEFYKTIFMRYDYGFKIFIKCIHYALKTSETSFFRKIAIICLMSEIYIKGKMVKIIRKNDKGN